MGIQLTVSQRQCLQQHQCLFFTDLDGTLLGHDAYDLADVPMLLQELRAIGFPVIFNTSKTQAEVEALQSQLNYWAPSIVENGAGIYVPEKSFWSFASSGQSHGAVLRDDILSSLREITGFKFEQMSQWSCDDVMGHTGLDRASAVLANQRNFSEPLLWQDSDAKLVQFAEKVGEYGLRLVRGGRFCHLMGQHDKSVPMQSLLKNYEEALGTKVVSIALGDNENDRRMLEMADIACVLALPGREPMMVSHSHICYADSVAPKGWVDSVRLVLSFRE